MQCSLDSCSNRIQHWYYIDKVSVDHSYHSFRGMNVFRDFVAETMWTHDLDGFNYQEPTAKKIQRTPIISLGPNAEWSGDGHDKLKKIGFPIYGIQDVASGKWLGLWVVPDNCLGNVVAYIYLSLVDELGGTLLTLYLIAVCRFCMLL